MTPLWIQGILGIPNAQRWVAPALALLPWVLVSAIAQAGSPTADFDAGERALRAGEIEKASALLKSACGAGLKAACVSWGAARAQLGDTQGARTAQQDACKQGLSLGCHNLGLLRKEAGDAEGARAAFAQGCAGDIDLACEHLGHQELSLGKGKAARTAFEKGCKLKSAASCHNRAALAREDKQDALALKFFRQGCRLGKYESCPPVERALKAKAPRSSQPNEYQALLAAYKKGCEKDKQVAHCFRLGELEEEAGRKSSAEGLFRQACELGAQQACQKLTP